MKLTKEILMNAGWEDKGGILVLRTPSCRFGWKEDGTMIVGYGELPAPVSEVRDMVDILRVCGAGDYGKKIQ